MLCYCHVKVFARKKHLSLEILIAILININYPVKRCIKVLKISILECSVIKYISVVNERIRKKKKIDYGGSYASYSLHKTSS